MPDRPQSQIRNPTHFWLFFHTHTPRRVHYRNGSKPKTTRHWQDGERKRGRIREQNEETEKWVCYIRKNCRSSRPNSREEANKTVGVVEAYDFGFTQMSSGKQSLQKLKNSEDDRSGGYKVYSVLCMKIEREVSNKQRIKFRRQKEREIERETMYV